MPLDPENGLCNTMASKITRNDLAQDLQALMTLPASALQGLNSSESHKQSQKPFLLSSEHRSALSLLDSYSTSTASTQDSQRLIAAYIRDTKGEVLAMDRTEGDRLGGRIDNVREKGEGVKDALSGVKI